MLSKNNAHGGIKSLLVWFWILFLALVLSSPLVFAVDGSMEIKVKAPYQVKPGTSLPIYITINHIGYTQINSLEATGQTDVVTVDSIEVFNPVFNGKVTEQSLSQTQIKKTSTTKC